MSPAYSGREQRLLPEPVGKYKGMWAVLAFSMQGPGDPVFKGMCVVEFPVMSAIPFFFFFS